MKKSFMLSPFFIFGSVPYFNNLSFFYLMFNGRRDLIPDFSLVQAASASKFSESSLT